MKYQYNVLLKILSQMKLWFLVYSIIICINVYNSCSGEIELAYTSFKNILGINVSIESLFFLSQMLLTIYFLHLFFCYEKSNSPEFIYLRMNPFKTNYKKYIISLVVVLLARLLYYGLLYLPFNVIIEINNSDFIINLLLYSFISIDYFIFHDFCLKIKYRLKYNRF